MQASGKVIVGPKRDALIERIRGYRSRGMTCEDMAAQVGMSVNTLRDIANNKRHGIREETFEKMLKIRLCVWRVVPGKLTAVRKRSGMSSSAVAKSAGLAEDTVRMWERGQRNPRRGDALDKVLATLGVLIEDIAVLETEDPAEEDRESLEQYISDAYVDEEISPYPCGVCGNNFESRRLLATHPHRGGRRG